MKTQIISAISGCLFSILAVSNASAQQPSKVLPSVTITSSNTEVSPRALKAFNRAYKDAENVEWFLRDKRFLVKFKQDAMKHHAIYLKSGFQVYHIGYGFEENLPSRISRMVKSTYGGYNIARTFVVDQDNRNIWIVGLQSAGEYIMAGVEEGQIREISRMTDYQSSLPVTSMIKKK